MGHKSLKFRDRAEAGRLLADKLERYKKDHPLILALPRGGVPVAFEVARRLEAPLDIIVIRKLGAPGNPEFGFGAVAPGDVLIIEEATVRALHLNKEDIDEVIARELKEMERRMLCYKSGSWGENTPAETIIVVDDGLATGLTARAALRSVKLLYQPRVLVFASPVCAEGSIEELRDFTDKVISLLTPPDLTAISMWYEHFEQVSDEEVLSYLNKANAKQKT